MRQATKICALVAACCLSAMQPAAADTPELRRLWREVRAQLRAGEQELPVERSLQRYVLYPYLEAAAILGQIGRPDTTTQALTAARAFLEQHGTSAVGDEFRRELLFVLADLQAWQTFIEFYSPDIANESRECEYLSARAALGLTDGLAPLVAGRWLTPRRLDSACEPAFQWLRDAGVLDEELTAQRIELLLEARQTEFARIVARRLPADTAALYIEWSQMLDAPISAIDRVVATEQLPAHPGALRSVWSRASIAAPQQAYARLANIADVLPQDDPLQEELIRELALGLAWDRREESLEVFASLSWSMHDDYTLGWLARAALWNGEIETAQRALAGMSAQTAGESGWTYWRGRISEISGQSQDARTAYADLGGRDNFYSALAAARTNVAIVPADTPTNPSGDVLAALARQPGIRRAEELFAAAERVLATREWRYATADLSTGELIAAVELASNWGWHDMAVATATRAQVFFDYRRLYPQAFAGDIALAADAHAIEPSLLSALIRQESMFRPDAVSSADALGLAQLRLATARQTARSVGMPQPDRSDLFEPAHNTMLGAATLRARLAGFADQLPVALAAYNAGPAAAARWLPGTALDSDIWIENIPYNETREYVRRVLWNTVVYSWLAGDGDPVDTGFLLSSISPAASD